MNSFFRKALVGTAMIVASLGGVQSAHALVPKGMAQFCASNSSQCRADSVGEVTMTRELQAVMQRVNANVNASIRAVAEAPGSDRWKLNPSSGDCEDFALTKRAQLIRQGVTPGALRIAITHTRRGEPHAVLVVKTSQGDYVLDNLRQRVVSLASSGYRLRFISSQDPMSWTRAS